ncbi:MAG: tetratricopeptide repeat-containing sensor histidine kinase [Chryseolinea sp.]
MLLCILVQLQFVCEAQHHDVDSLENVVKSMPADTTKVRKLNTLVTTLRERDNNKALRYAQQARDLATSLKDLRGLGGALENLGWIHYRTGDYSEAFELSVKALSIGESFNDLPLIARCLNSIAAVNVEQNQHAMGISNFQKAFKISSDIGDGTSMARSLNNIAFCFLHINQIDSARIYALKGYETSKKFSIPYLSAFALRTLGDLDLHDKRFEHALAKFNSVLKIADSVKNVFLKVSTLHRIGKTYFELQNYDRAIGYLNRNVIIAGDHKFRSELERSLKLLSEIYAAKKDLNKAFEYQSQYLIAHDSLYKQRSSEQMALMQARFDSEIKQAQIDLLNKNAQLKQEEINRHRLWTYSSAGLLSLMAILAFVLFYNNGLKKKANDALGLKNTEIQLQAQQLKNINVTKDKLFSIISHDLRGPLASLRGLMEIMGMDGLTNEEFVASSHHLRKNLDSVQQDLDNLLAWAQSQLNGFQSNPTPLRLRPVVDEKILLFSEIARQKDITIVNEIDESLSVIADVNHMGLVMRNLLANAIKFNKRGGIIKIQEKRLGEFTEISVYDSGVGMTAKDLGRLFNAETHFTNPGTQQEKGAGIGLLLTKEFIEKNGGAIWATSEFGKGSTFTFTVRRELMADAVV